MPWCARIGTLCIAVPCLLALPSHADILNVPADYATIQEAIDAAVDGDEVVIAPGRHILNELSAPDGALVIPDKTITLRSQDPTNPGVAAATILDGGTYGPIALVEHGGLGLLVVDGLSFANGKGTSDGSFNIGGALRIDGCAVVVRHCIFSDPYNWRNSTSRGDAIAAVGSSDVRIEDCAFLDMDIDPYRYAGALYLVDSTAEITDCFFYGSSVQTSGAELMLSSSIFDDSLGRVGNDGAADIYGCVFGRESAVFFDASVGIVSDSEFYDSGHVYAAIESQSGGNLTVAGCNFEGCGAGTNVATPAVFRDCEFRFCHIGLGARADCDVRRCRFIANSAVALSHGDNGKLFAQDCVFLGNSGSFGSAVQTIRTDSIIDRCGFFANYSDSGIIWVYSTPVATANTITDCRFVGNGTDVTATSRLILWRSSGDLTIDGTVMVDNDTNGLKLEANNIAVTNSVIWGMRTNEIEMTYGASAEIEHCIVQDGAELGSTVIDAEPLFTRAPFDGGDGWRSSPFWFDPDAESNNDYGDLRPAPNSPMIDAGDNTVVPADIFDLDNDGDTTEPIPFDLDGNPRFLDDTAIPDSGVAGAGYAQVIDIGPYEFQGTSPDPCRADLTSTNAPMGDPAYGVPDGATTAADIQFYINAWITLGTLADMTTQNAPAGDPNFGVPDGLVTAADLQFYVNLWLAGCP